MRIIAANHVFTGKEIIPNAGVAVDSNGRILDFIFTLDNLDNVEYHQGLLAPGFINCHCHLELSHMKGKVAEGKGLVQFIKELQSQRDQNPDEIQQAIADADAEMKRNGIVAVGDISNGTDSFQVKSKSEIAYHTFIELYGFLDAAAQESYEGGKAVANTADTLGLPNTLVPHSPYAASPMLMQLIKENSKETDVFTMHNQETTDENLLFQEGKGSFMDLMQWFNLDTSFWQPTNKNALPSVLKNLPKDQHLILVHNTFTNEQDLTDAVNYNPNIFWCFCPNANSYIENAAPNFKAFIQNNVTCTVGTDSLTSNWSLSILDELKTIHKKAPQILLNELFQWATINGAKALRMDNKLGSFDVGKTPGINLISNWQDLQIAEVERLM